MRLRSLAFAGYRSFAARSPATPDRPLERLELAPLTLLLGKNNSGKSTAARLLHHFLLALGHDGKDLFPMEHGDRRYGASFQDVQHAGAFFNPLDLDAELIDDDGNQTKFAAQLVLGSSTDDQLPIIQRREIDGKSYPADDSRRRGLLPDVKEAIALRDGARRLLRASCHLGPVRDTVQHTYRVDTQIAESILPNSSADVAKLLLADTELRSIVGDWTAEHLERWRVDVRQTLDVFSLVTRRGGRETNVAASGQGTQQVLPVATLCGWRKLGRGDSPFLDIMEQPELHLHDAAHAPLGDLLLSAIESGRGNLVVETHSEALVLRVRLRVAEGLPPDRVAIYYVEDAGDGSRLRRIPLADDGEVEWWPDGVFSESFNEVKAIRRAQRARGGA